MQKIEQALQWLKRSCSQLYTRFRNLSRIGKLAIIALGVVGIPVLAFVLLFLLVWAGAFGSLPDRAELRNINTRTATEVYSADSVLLGTFYIQERSNISYNQIPQSLIDALVCTEDVRFYKHNGVDYKSLARVLIKSVIMRQDAGGGSTLTQQLTKNLYPRGSYGFLSMPVNKIKEAITATRIEAIYSKEEILTMYLNTVPFGDGAFGIESAARRYFSKPAQHLSLTEGAVLVGMLKATYTYNPRIFPDASKARRNVVLAQMKHYGKLDSAEFDSLASQPVEVKYSRITHHSGLAPYFRNIVKQQVVEWCATHTRADGKHYNIYSDGLKVYTTINAGLQQFAEAGMAKQMKQLQNRFDRHWGKQDPWGSDQDVVMRAVRRSDRYRQLKAQGLTEDSIVVKMKKPVLTRIFTWDGEKEVKISPYDSVRHHLKFLHAGMLAMDPHTGAVRVWVGGINHQYFQYDHVKASTKRQVGSTFKPIVYAAAIENGMRPCDYVSAAHVTYANLEGWAPENGAEEDYDRKYSLAGGLAHSVNTVSVGIMEETGIDKVKAMAEAMGIDSKLPSVPALALGVASISVSEMVTAYSTFVNDGLLVKPFIITSITDHNDQRLYVYEPDDYAERVMSEETAAMMVSMLGRVVDEGTGVALRTQFGLRNEMGGKTGTTQSNADGWFMCVTPSLVVGTWVGADDPQVRFRSTALGQGAATALPIVGRFMQQVNASPKFTDISRAQFPELTARMRRQLNCDLWKKDQTWFDRLLGKEKGPVTRDYGDKTAKRKKKKGFFDRLFGKD